jgi:solute:Na+ symporter, SSS family
MSLLDVILYVVSVVGVIALGIWKSRDEIGHVHQGEESTAGYFLAGRSLSWWLVGFSLIAANISTEQFVGMSGKAADWLGMAIASYEWMAAISLVIVGFVFLPKLLRCGIYTIPEFLEYRYGIISRTVMALATLVILVGVPTASVIYSGAKVVSVFAADYPVLNNLTAAVWMVGLLAAVYVFVGGLKACAWTDLVWGVGLILGGAIILVLAFQKLGDTDPAELFATRAQTATVTPTELADANPIERFLLLNEGPAADGPNGAGGKLHMVRPKTDAEIPWTALILGLWIPNLFYWGLNQYIVQRTLGSRSLAEGQKGIVFAAALKIVIPFIVVIPGILAFHLFRADLQAEAARKNTPVLAEFQSGAAKIFSFTPHFAALDPDTAAGVLAHNAAVLGGPPSAAAAEAAARFEVNTSQVDQARSRKLPVAPPLVGYDYDAAFPILMRNLLFPGISWFVLAAITGAVISSLAAMLNSASTIATMDIVHKLAPSLKHEQLVTFGRGFVVLFVIISCLIAPGLDSPQWGGVFTFIQEFQGFISSGILAIFLFGFLAPRAPRYLGWLGILLNVAVYGILKMGLDDFIVRQGWWFAGSISFLDRMGISFLVIMAVLTACTLLHPLKEPVKLPVTTAIPLEPSRGALGWGLGVVAVTLLMYVIFW